MRLVSSLVVAGIASSLAACGGSSSSTSSNTPNGGPAVADPGTASSRMQSSCSSGTCTCVGQLHRGLHVVAVHGGLLGRQLRADLPGFGRLHGRLFGRSLPDLLRRRYVQRRVLVGPLQHVVPERRRVHGELLGGRLRACLRRRGALHGLELLGRGL
jgi:hypothetical protein